MNLVDYNTGMYGLPSVPPALRRVRPAPLLLTLCVAISFGLGAWPIDCCASPPAVRYEAAAANGERHRAHRITAWQPGREMLRLDDQEWSPTQPALRWIIDHQAELPSSPSSWIETWTGDQLPGEVVSYSAASSGNYQQSPCLIVRSVTPTRPPILEPGAMVRILLPFVRRIVWQDEGHRYRAGTVRTRDGRRLAFRAIRWNADSVTLLTNDGREILEFRELAELNLPDQTPWPLLFRELAVVAPGCSEQLIQFETSSGVVVTTSWQRQRVARPQDRTKAANWMHAVQPAWSLDVLWLAGNEVPVRRFFHPHEVPLSRLRPVSEHQQSPLAGNGRPWQLNRNADGQWLRCGEGSFGWGFGVHASNELGFSLPGLATAVEGFVGIDSVAGTGGCIQATVLVRSGGRQQQLFQTPIVVGSQQAYATGKLILPGDVNQGAPPAKDVSDNRQLVLQVDHAHDQRPVGADPLDIRDSTDWLDPLLYLEPEKLRNEVARQTPAYLFACRDWRWQLPKATQLQFQNVWDDLSQDRGHFALAVIVRGNEPARLQRLCPPSKIGKQLIITVSCPLRTNPPQRMDVIADGELLATFEVPVLDRRHLQLAPQSISLQMLDTTSDDPIEFEIRQYPGALEAPVQYHSIEFASP